MKIFFYLFILFCFTYSNQICNDLVCCPSECITCHNCTISNAINSQCCDTIIMNSNRTCDIFDAPCIVDINSETNDEPDISSKAKKYYEAIGLMNTILICIATVVLISLIYSCTCFDHHRKPPLPYDTIANYTFEVK